MKRGLFLLATVTLSSALYAQQLTADQARQIIKDFSPQLLERASENKQVAQLVEQLIASYLEKQPANDTVGKYELVALARNFDNSLALFYVANAYQDALRYANQGGEVDLPAIRQHAQQQLKQIFSRIWAVSMQVKQAQLEQYKREYHELKNDKTLTSDQKNLRLESTEDHIVALKTEIKRLNTDVGEHLVTLADQTLAQAQAAVLAEQTALRQTSNLQIKTKHKKPVAE